MTDEIDVTAALRAWPIGSARSTTPLSSGSNNDNWLIETREGHYVLRVYRNANAQAGIPFEHALLRSLANAALPFEVPAPVPTVSGATAIETSRGLASLARRITGRHPELDNEADVRVAGAALGQLDAVLSSIQVSAPHPSPWGYGDLKNVHPAVTDPSEALATLTQNRWDRARYERAVGETEAAWPTLVACLPTQIIHADYVRTNVIIANNVVNGVLDFEFSAPDLRAMALAVGIYDFCLRGRIDGDKADVIALTRVFTGGFFERLALSHEELAALPLLLIRRQIVGCLHWFGRWKLGLSSELEARERFTRLSDLQRWLDTEGTEVLASLAPTQPAAGMSDISPDPSPRRTTQSMP